jgi:hypothetical protein
MTAVEPIEPEDTPESIDDRNPAHPERWYVRCKATNRDKEPCGRWAINGGTVCPSHGGNTPQVRRKAAENLLRKKLLKLVPDPEDRAPITDYVEELFLLAEEMKATKETLAVMVNDLAELGYRGGLFYGEDGRLQGTGTEQTRAEWMAYERSQEKLGRLLIEIGKLDLEGKRFKLQVWQEQQMAAGSLAVVGGVLAALGLSIDDQQVRGLVVEQLKALPPVIEA